jgi:hypothetical protein
MRRAETVSWQYFGAGMTKRVGLTHGYAMMHVQKVLQFQFYT